MNRPDHIDENCTNMSKQTEIHEAMTQDTPVKSISNSAHMNNIIAYDREVQRISKSVCSRLDLGQISLQEHNHTIQVGQK